MSYETNPYLIYNSWLMNELDKASATPFLVTKANTRDLDLKTKVAQLLKVGSNIISEYSNGVENW